MNERDRLIDEIGTIEIRLLVLGLPAETASLLDYDLTLQQLRVFAYILGHGRLPISKVAEALAIKPNVATGIIQRLVDRELVERHEDPNDRRVRLIAVTPRGFAMIDELSGIVLAKSRELLDRLSHEQLQQFRDLLVAMEPQPGPVGMK